MATTKDNQETTAATAGLSRRTSNNRDDDDVAGEKQLYDHMEKSDDAASVDARGIPVDDPVEAKRIIRKVDWRIIPLLMFLYTLTFLDRVNIGNARLWSLEEDLGMSGYDYNLAILVFYIPYIILEV